MPENTPEYGDVPARPTYTIDGREVSYEEFASLQLTRRAALGETAFIQTKDGFIMDTGGEPGTHEEMLETTKDWENLGYTDADVSGDLELLARAVEANAGLEPGLVSATPEFRNLLSDPGVLEALLAEAVEQVRGPLHYRGDVAHSIMFQIVGPDRRGEALVPVEATYSIEEGWTEVWYRVATPADVEYHVASVGRSAA